MYQPGSQFIYRKYGGVTVSTSSALRWLESMCSSRAKSELALARAGRLTDEYKKALATGYFETARASYSLDPHASFAIYANAVDGLIGRILDLCPRFSAADSRTFMAIQSLFGLGRAMHIIFRFRAATNVVRCRLKQNKLLLNLVLRARGVRIERERDRRPHLFSDNEPPARTRCANSP